MFEGKQFRCDWRLPAVLALVVAMAGAFGLASTRATADDVTVSSTVVFKVTDVETGVTGTAYKYMSVNWDTHAKQPGTPEYIFESKVADWMRQMRGGL